MKSVLEPSGEIVADADGDGFLSGEDCDDTDADINLGMSEICDGSDNNCDGQLTKGTDNFLRGYRQ